MRVDVIAELGTGFDAFSKLADDMGLKAVRYSRANPAKSLPGAGAGYHVQVDQGVVDDFVMQPSLKVWLTQGDTKGREATWLQESNAMGFPISDDHVSMLKSLLTAVDGVWQEEMRLAGVETVMVYTEELKDYKQAITARLELAVADFLKLMRAF